MRRRRLGAVVATTAIVLVVASVSAAATRSSSHPAHAQKGASHARLLTDPKLPPAPKDVGSANVAGAQKFLLSRFGVPKFISPGPAFDIKKVTKPVWFIAQVTSLPVTPYINKGFLQAAKAAGVSAHVCAGFGTPQGNSTCLQQAAQAKAGSAEIFSVDPKTIEKPLADARKAGVKTVAGNDAVRIGEKNPVNIDAEVSHNYYDAGVLSGAYAVATWGAATASRPRSRSTARAARSRRRASRSRSSSPSRSRSSTRRCSPTPS
jgi:ABC-type sugar transport system substrate-binding protein